VVFDCTERNLLLPVQYLGPHPPPCAKITSFSQLDSLPLKNPDYVVVFADKLTREHIDNLANYYPKISTKSHFPPSTIDYILNKLNPKYNHTNESWVMKIEYENVIRERAFEKTPD